MGKEWADVVDIGGRKQGRKVRHKPTFDQIMRMEGEVNWDDTHPEATDKKGHSDELRIRMPQGTVAVIQDLIADLPQYRNHQDFARSFIANAIVYHAGKKRDEDGDFNNPSIPRYLRRLENERRARERIEQVDEVETAIDAVTREMGVGQVREVRHWLSHLIEMRDEWTDSDSMLNRIDTAIAQARAYIKQHGPKPKAKR